MPAAVTYVVFQVERGEAGTPHIQGYIQFKNRMRMNQVKTFVYKPEGGSEIKPFERAHLEVARGKMAENHTYCTKSEGRLEGPWEAGTPSRQGDRADLKEAADTLLKTGRIDAVDPQIILKYGSNAFKLIALAPAPRRDDLMVITFCGGTGIGKSWAARDIFENVHTVTMGNSGLWWDGYIAQDVVVFEEFVGQVPLQKML